MKEKKNIIYAYFFWQDSCFVQFLFNVIYFRLLYKHVEAQIGWRNVLFSHQDLSLVLHSLGLYGIVSTQTRTCNSR